MKTTSEKITVNGNLQFIKRKGVDYLDNVIPLTLIEELLDVHTTMGCEKLFSFVEKRKSRITVVSRIKHYLVLYGIKERY